MEPRTALNFSGFGPMEMASGRPDAPHTAGNSTAVVAMKPCQGGIGAGHDGTGGTGGGSVRGSTKGILPRRGSMTDQFGFV